MMGDLELDPEPLYEDEPLVWSVVVIVSVWVLAWGDGEGNSPREADDVYASCFPLVEELERLEDA